MQTSDTVQPKQQPRSGYRNIGGIALVLLGSMLFLDQFLKTGWLTWVVIPIGLSLVLTAAITSQKMKWIIPACLMLGLGAGAFVGAGPVFKFSLFQSIGAGLIIFSLGWLLIVLFSRLFTHLVSWWALIPAAVLAGAGFAFYLNRVSIVGFAFFIALDLGLVFVIWGYFQRMIGLIIPGSLLITIGPGVYTAWRDLSSPNGLTQTGIMLVWFALGWLLITVLSRAITEKFIWWPLIPGGILGMIGCGLYIGGSPSTAATFLSNTGAIGLIVFGIYLLLLRRGIRR